MTYTYIVHRPLYNFNGDDGDLMSISVEFTSTTPLTYDEVVTQANLIPTDYWVEDEDYITNEEGDYCVEVCVDGEWNEVR